MKNSTSNKNGKERETDVEGTVVNFPLPVREKGVFKHAASSHVLNFLADNPEVNVSIRQLSRITPVSERSTREAVDVLAANGLIETFHEGNARRVQINRERLQKPSDPTYSIPQSSFWTPVRVATVRITEEFESVRGIVLFGSVARGKADARSDIDLWVLVEGDSRDLLQYRHAANTIARELEELRIPSTIPLSEAKQVDFEAQWETIKEELEDPTHSVSGTERRSFEIIVETPASILTQSTRVDPERLFGDGITLRSSETLERVKQEVLRDD